MLQYMSNIQNDWKLIQEVFKMSCIVMLHTFPQTSAMHLNNLW